MNRKERRRQAALIGTGHAPWFFLDLRQLVPLAKRRAGTWIYDGRANAQNQERINACAYLYSITPEISARLIYTRDAGHHTGGWWANPDYERCLHLSLSFIVNPTDDPLPFLREPAAAIARAFWGEAARQAWIERPYSDDGKRLDVWHYRLFCDVTWSPQLPRGEVYSRENTPRNWRSFSEVHNLDLSEIDAPFLLNAT